MADQHPYRNVNTGLTQYASAEIVALFPGQFELLPDDYDELQAQADAAAAAVEAAKDAGLPKTEVKAAQKDADAAASAVAEAPTPVPADGTEIKES